MPTGRNWLSFVYVNLAFAIYIAGVFYYNQLALIRKDWPLYRCNPMYMPLAEDVGSNFTYCIQTMQTNYMGYLLEPLTFITSSLGTTLGNFANDLNSIRAMFSKVRGKNLDIVQSIFGVFLNLIIEFQKITISIKDLIGKLIGVMTTLLYTMDGALLTMQSTWNGPPGQMVQALGKCFHPDTSIKLNDGTIKKMKDLDLGDVLENGVFIDAVLKIDNKREPVELYVNIGEGIGVSGEKIYVTGSHLVQHKDNKKLLLVKDSKDYKKSDVKTDYLMCLITSNHIIKIGDETFWDWEDHFIKYKLFCV